MPRRDARRVAGDPEAAALLECLAENLFNPALDTGFMGRVALGENPRGLDHPTMGERWSCGCPSFALWGDAHGQGVAHRLPQAIAYGEG